MAPTMTPAVAVATPMPIMLREPSLKPPTTEFQPASHVPAVLARRNSAMSGRWVSMSTTSVVTAQNAESEGDISSTIRHQISMAIGIR